MAGNDYDTGTCNNGTTRKMLFLSSRYPQSYYCFPKRRTLSLWENDFHKSVLKCGNTDIVHLHSVCMQTHFSLDKLFRSLCAFTGNLRLLQTLEHLNC